MLFMMATEWRSPAHKFAESNHRIRRGRPSCYDRHRSKVAESGQQVCWIYMKGMPAIGLVMSSNGPASLTLAP
jgi:hypothetical protein